MNNMDSIKELEQELMRVRLGIVEDEKEFKELDNKIKNLYVKFPLGFAYGIWGLWFTICLGKGEGGENAFGIFGIIFLASIFWTIFMLFGTSAGQRARKLYYTIIPAKKKKKKTVREQNKTIALFSKS